jgi:hypothetical protein
VSSNLTPSANPLRALQVVQAALVPETTAGPSFATIATLNVVESASNSCAFKYLTDNTAGVKNSLAASGKSCRV